jgi:hypothetical protein
MLMSSVMAGGLVLGVSVDVVIIWSSQKCPLLCLPGTLIILKPLIFAIFKSGTKTCVYSSVLSESAVSSTGFPAISVMLTLSILPVPSPLTQNDRNDGLPSIAISEEKRSEDAPSVSVKS